MGSSALRDQAGGRRAASEGAGVGPLRYRTTKGAEQEEEETEIKI